MKILLIEDNPDDASYIQKMSPGNTFIHCADLKSALEYLNMKPEDLNLIVMDLGLPDSQGEQTLDSVLACTEAPIIILADYISDEITAKAIKAGKPILEKDILNPQLFNYVLKGMFG